MEVSEIWKWLLQNALAHLQMNDKNNGNYSHAFPYRWQNAVGPIQDCWIYPFKHLGLEDTSSLSTLSSRHIPLILSSPMQIGVGVCMCICKCILNQNQTLQCEHCHNSLRMRELTQIRIASFNVLLETIQILMSSV